MVVVTPLLALMKDQVAAFTSKGLYAAYIGSDTDIVTRDAACEGQFQLLLFSPERQYDVTAWAWSLARERLHN